MLDATEGSLGPALTPSRPTTGGVVLATFTPHLVASVAGGVLTEDPSVPVAARQWLDGVLQRRGAPDHVADLLWEQLRGRLHEYPASRALLG